MVSIFEPLTILQSTRSFHTALHFLCLLLEGIGIRTHFFCWLQHDSLQHLSNLDRNYLRYSFVLVNVNKRAAFPRCLLFSKGSWSFIWLDWKSVVWHEFQQHMFVGFNCLVFFAHPASKANHPIIQFLICSISDWCSICGCELLSRSFLKKGWD